MVRHRGLRELLAILNGFRNCGIRIMIGAAALAAGALSASHANAALIPTTDGSIVYDSVTNISWVADANLAASNQFGLPVCKSGAPLPCVNASGSMRYNSALAWVSAMNTANYFGHFNWQLPTTPITDNGCGFVGPRRFRQPAGAAQPAGGR